jgi:RNA-dependent RNA polymerase
MGRTLQVRGFALTDSADYVKDSLERIAGTGTVYALKLRHPKNITATSRAFAIVQFQTQESALFVENAAQRNVLRSGRSYLTARPADRDIIPRPRTTMFRLDDAMLHFGCLVKENVLSVLLSAKEVSVQFGFHMRKIHLYLSYNFKKYKLEVSYESIWEIQLHRPPAYRSRTKFLLIQVGSLNFSGDVGYTLGLLLLGSSFHFKGSKLMMNVGSNDFKNDLFDFISCRLIFLFELLIDVAIWKVLGFRVYIYSELFAVFQVQAAPKIYELTPRRSGIMFEDPFFNYFSDDMDDQWTRTTDFTPSVSIGQSFILCLEVPRQCDLPNIGDYFVYYKEYNLDFECRMGYSYSCDTRLVPVVKSFHVEVPYEVLFKINHLVQNGTLSGPTLDDNFFHLVNPNIVPIEHIKRALEKMSYLKSTCLNPTNWLSVQYSKIRRLRNALQRSPNISLDDGLVYVHRVQVTPAKVYFYGPEINVSNRVVRHFSANLDNFLRVSFVDEDCEKLRSADLSPRSAPGNARRTALYDRVLSVLSNGISIGDKHFEFLAFSSSQLRDNSAWMFASHPGLSASCIRKWMGDFRNIRNVAKYAARLGQSFSSSTETLKVEKYEVDEIPDITNGTKYIFSDGIGKISARFAREVAMKCKLKRFAPSVFQIRYGGCKGVVAVDPRSNQKLSLRKSMIKFESENTTLDVLAYSKYQPCFLNRQLITLLSTLGVQDRIFELKQEEAVRQLNRMVTEPQAAIEAIELMPMGEITNSVKDLLLCGYQPAHEPYLSMLLQTFRASKLLELKTKSRIFIPHGRAMMGCLDETGTLKYGQVFVQASSRANDSQKIVVTGKVVVAKNPCLHPGDVRVLQAVDVPSLHHMFDCVVFPQKGSRQVIYF